MSSSSETGHEEFDLFLIASNLDVETITVFDNLDRIDFFCFFFAPSTGTINIKS